VIDKKCIICDWEGVKFDDDNWHNGVVCPNCKIKVRHRLLIATLKNYSNHEELSYTRIGYNKNIIHFSPERSISNYVSKLAKEFIKADLTREDCFKVNMMNMSIFPDNRFDLAIACDILEHVDDDIIAMKELHRIIKPDGYAILSVPQLDPPAMTDEDPTITDEKIRIQRFGQKDHVRIYGDDFRWRLELVGFKVTVIDENNFSPEVVSKYGLKPLTLSSHPLVTNYRRIYFAKK
jgi:SAM-dependent methyltransferase